MFVLYLFTCPLVNLSTRQLVHSSTCPLVNLSTRQLVNLSTRQLSHLFIALKSEGFIPVFALNFEEK